MATLVKPQRMTARIPSAVCTPETRQQLDQIAEAEDVDLSVIVRNAIDVFLAEYIPNGDKNIQKESEEQS